MKVVNKILYVLNTIHAIFKRRLPLMVNLSLTDRCNFNCLYCSTPKWNRKEMSLQQIFTLIDELAKRGNIRLGLTGGEALLREDIGEIIRYAKRKKIFTTIITNGWLIEEKIDEIKDLDALIVSLDGPKKIHDMLKKKGSYDKLMEGIKLANEYGMRIWSVTVLTKYNTNLRCIDFILKKAKELNFYTYYQLLIRNAPAISGIIDPLLPSRSNLKSVFKKLIEEKSKGAPIIQSKECLMYLYNWPDYRITQWEDNWPSNIKKGKCYAGKLFCSITCDGYVYPCLVKIGKVPSLNFLDVGFDKAFSYASKQVKKNCWCHVNIEYNNLCSLSPTSLLNLIGKVI
jgi:MoaA/NifB/PqqE/SkfB family radical SAM enzyme